MHHSNQLQTITLFYLFLEAESLLVTDSGETLADVGVFVVLLPLDKKQNLLSDTVNYVNI